jgi:hypothetical protein
VTKIEKEEIGSTRGGMVVKTFGVPGGKEISLRRTVQKTVEGI